MIMLDSPEDRLRRASEDGEARIARDLLALESARALGAWKLGVNELNALAMRIYVDDSRHIWLRRLHSDVCLLCGATRPA